MNGNFVIPSISVIPTIGGIYSSKGADVSLCSTGQKFRMTDSPDYSPTSDTEYNKLESGEDRKTIGNDDAIKKNKNPSPFLKRE